MCLEQAKSELLVYENLLLQQDKAKESSVFLGNDNSSCSNNGNNYNPNNRAHWHRTSGNGGCSDFHGRGKSNVQC